MDKIEKKLCFIYFSNFVFVLPIKYKIIYSGLLAVLKKDKENFGKLFFRFVVTEFVKTCDEFVITLEKQLENSLILPPFSFVLNLPIVFSRNVLFHLMI